MSKDVGTSFKRIPLAKSGAICVIKINTVTYKYNSSFSVLKINIIVYKIGFCNSILM